METVLNSTFCFGLLSKSSPLALATKGTQELRLKATSRFYDPSSGAKVQRFFETTKYWTQYLQCWFVSSILNSKGRSRLLPWHAVSWFFPSTFGMNGYVRITSMGCSLRDIRTERLALWAQAAVYFTTACLMYRRHILKMVRTKER